MCSVKRDIQNFGLALVAVLAFGAVAAGAAQADSAPHWTTGGKGEPLPAGATRNFVATSTTKAFLRAPNLGLTLENPVGKCSATGKIEGSGAGLPGKNKEVTLTCHEVTVVEGAKCSVHSPGQPNGTVVTNELKSTNVWLNKEGGAAGDLLTPGTGTEFVSIIIEGCALAETYPVTGEIIGQLLPVEKEVEEGEIVFPEPPILSWWNNKEPREAVGISRLAVKKSPATFEAKFNLHLEPKELVGVFAG
jgi:hypothetical protein